jgi:hypothetical protein
VSTVWKFPFELYDEEQPFDYYPQGMMDSKPFVGLQHSRVCLWQRVESDAVLIQFVARIVGTGHEFDRRWHYVGSAIDPRGFVWHLIIRPADK